jgi:2-dehydro-3-deoxygluconokinase
MRPDAVASAAGADVAELVTMGETMALLSHAKTTPLRHARTLDVGVGGSESNVAIAAARLGVPTAWIGRVGADELGEMVLRELRAEGVRTVAKVDDERPTAMMLKARRTSRNVRVTYYRKDSAGSLLNPSDVDLEVLKQASVFHTSAITAAISDSAANAVYKSIEVCRASGTLVSIDLNYRQALWSEAEARKEFRQLASMADVVFATEAEARIACGGAEPCDLVEELAGMARGRAIVKLGEKGAIASIDGEQLIVAPIPVREVDPVGAGDAFAAGYLAASLQRLDPATALHWGAFMGAWAVATDGDWQGLPSRAELTTIWESQDVRR